MLEKIHQLIKEAKQDATPFEQFYVNYIMQVQDANIDEEVSSMFRRMSIEVSTLNKADKLIEQEHRKMVK